jgi:hypothetical protein
MPKSSFFRILAASAVVFAASQAHAVGTRTFVLDTLEKLSGGDLHGVAVGSDGVVRAGLTLGNAPVTDATAVFSAARLADGSVLLGTSPSGKVYKATGDQLTLFADTGTLAVTSIVQAANGTIYAGTIPEGKIFKLSQGKADHFVTVPDASYVWQLALDKQKSGLFAACGPDGKVVRVEPNGSTSVYYRSDEPHIVSVAVADSGDLYAGSSGKGLLYKITGPGRASVLYDFPGNEVKGIAVTKNGTVFAIANEYAEPPEPPRRSSPRAQPGPGNTTTRPKPGKGVLYRFDPSGKPEKLMAHNDFHYMSLALDDKDQPYVGSGAEGRVYTVDDAHAVSLVADTDERQVGALIMSGNTRVVASSDPAVYHRVLGQGGPDSVWTSKVLDAGLRAKWGTLQWHATGALELSTRSGNTATPDATWAPWSAPHTTPGAVTSPPGRYVQVRARWRGDPKATLTQVSLPFLTDNMRPVVLEVSAQQKGVTGTREPASSIPASGGEPSKHDSVVKVTWKVDNPDSDALRYRVSFRREGQPQWRDALKADEVLTKTELDWDTQSLPEGRYRVRVEASDEIANPPDQVQKHALESDPVLVDNTPPIIANLTLVGRRLKARVVDGLGPITRVEIAVDGKTEWRPLGAADGIFDGPDESVDADVSALVPPGSHIVAVRAYDAAGNYVVREIDAN